MRRSAFEPVSVGEGSKACIRMAPRRAARARENALAVAIWSGPAPRKSQPRLTIASARAKSGTARSAAPASVTSSASGTARVACQTSPGRASASAAIWRARVGEATGPVSSRALRPSGAIAASSSASKAGQVEGVVPREGTRGRAGSKRSSTAASANTSVAPRLAGWPGLPWTLVGRPSWLSTITPRPALPSGSVVAKNIGFPGTIPSGMSM